MMRLRRSFTLPLLLALLPAILLPPPPLQAAPAARVHLAAPPGTGRCLDATPGDCLPVSRHTRLLLPDLQTLPPDEFRLLADAASGQKALRFSNSVVNLGPSAIEVAGTRLAGSTRVELRQRLPRSDGTWVWQSIGSLEFHPEHDHWHWTQFSVYEVWSVRPGGQLLRRVAQSGKVGYCLRDNAPLSEMGVLGVRLHTDRPARDPVFTTCGWQRQGISAGWTDIYDYNTPGQSINLSRAPDGLYALKSVVDPDGVLIERDKANNTAVVYFHLEGTAIEYFGVEPPE